MLPEAEHSLSYRAVQCQVRLSNSQTAVLGFGVLPASTGSSLADEELQHAAGMAVCSPCLLFPPSLPRPAADPSREEKARGSVTGVVQPRPGTER